MKKLSFNRRLVLGNGEFYIDAKLLFILIIGLVSGCNNNTIYAPVVERSQLLASKPGVYRVKSGDTLYSIAWGFGLDYRDLAVANHLKPPYRIHPGQKITTKVIVQQKGPLAVLLSTEKKAKKAAKKSTKQLVYFHQWHSQKELTDSVPHWVWPARGQVVAQFNNSLSGNKGINIAGRYGQPIKASAKGIVVYSGDGVRGYGNLIIVKHSDSYLSAYAFNKRALVKEGMRVHKGQVIAEMGRDNTGSVMLHFEIRQNGKPVNPLKYLS